MVLGVSTVTGFAPARDGGEGGASGTGVHERNVRAAVATGTLSPDTGDRITTKPKSRPATDTGAGVRAPEPQGDAAEDFGAEHVRARVARVLPAALAPVCGSGYGREVMFPLFGDMTVQAVEEARSTVGSTLVWHGTVAGTVDQNVVVTLDGGCDRTPGNEILSAQFLLGGDLYAIEPLGPGRVTIAQLTPLTDEDEQPTGAPPAAAIAAEAAGRKKSAAEDEDDTRAALKAAAACKGGKGYALIDTLVGCTPGARTEAGGDAQIKALATKGVTLANDAFAASGTKVRLRLVGTTPVTVPAAQDGVTNSLLGALALPADGVADNVPQLRDRYGADLVSVIAAGRAAGGLGYTPPEPGPSTAA